MFTARFLLGLLYWIMMNTQMSIAAEAAPMQPSHIDKVPKELIAKARNHGAVRVIVTLDMKFLPEGNWPDQAAVDQQRNTIAELQIKVLEKLRDCQVAGVRRYKYTSTLALEVDACGLGRLIEAPEVSRISEDKMQQLMQPDDLL